MIPSPMPGFEPIADALEWQTSLRMMWNEIDDILRFPENYR